MPPRPTDDLDWTAFRYVVGELPPAEAAAFEARLVGDQPAREAVAAAVELAGALALAVEGRVPACPGHRRRSGPSRVLAWAGAAVAASACLLAFRGMSARPGGPEVARAWSGIQAAPDGEWTSLVAEAPHDAGSSAMAEIDPGIESDATAGRGVPSWMLAAAGPKADPAPGEAN